MEKTGNERKNGLPFLERTEINAAVAAESIKREIAALFRAAADELAIEALVVESPNLSPTPKVFVSVWNRQPNATLFTYRSNCSVSILPTDYCTFPYEINLEIESPAYRVKQEIQGVVSFTATDARDLLRAMLRGDKAPGFNRTRKKPFQLWLPKNKVRVLRPDYGAFIGAGLILVAPALFFFQPELWIWCLLLFAGGIGAAALWPKPKLSVSSGRPPEDPLVLLRVDEWQAAVRGLGADAVAFQSSLESDLLSSLPEGATVRPYPETYIGEDGVIFKNRLLVRHRRAAVFIDIESYKDELFVGWESKLNLGTWSEVLLGTGIHRDTGDRCKVYAVRGKQGTAQRQDEQDAVFLGELVQSKVRHWLRQYLDQRRIEERLDFEIVRAGREPLPSVEEKQKNPLKRLLRID